jgi:secondary thiamine-phosphate synthase enzyme
MKTISVKSQTGQECIDITSQVQDVVRDSGVHTGYCLLYVPHTTAGITLNEGADPHVREDILHFLSHAVPEKGDYRHLEGNADAHIKSSLVGVSHTIPIQGGGLLLGTWQAVFFCEFDGPRTRRVCVQIVESTQQATT